MPKIFILPETGDSSSFHSLSLKHPKDSSECAFYFEQSQNRIYELTVQRNQFYSWFSSDTLVNDGNLHLLTPIDPLFLLIPYIYKNTDKFQNLYDILAENSIANSNIERLQTLYPENVLKCIGDIQNFEDDIFIKFSTEKTLKWLSLKFEGVKKSLVKNGIGKNLFGFKASDYVSGDNQLSEDEYKVLAFEVISDYICPDLEQALRAKLSIPDRKKLLASFDEKTVSNNKRKLESDHKISEAYNDDISDTKPSKESNNKKQKMTRTERALSKVDKTGMKSIASYFQKKK